MSGHGETLGGEFNIVDLRRHVRVLPQTVGLANASADEILIDPKEDDIKASVERIRTNPNNQGLRGVKILDQNGDHVHTLLWPDQSWAHKDIRNALKRMGGDFSTAANATFVYDELAHEPSQRRFSRTRTDEIFVWMRAPVTEFDRTIADS